MNTLEVVIIAAGTGIVTRMVAEWAIELCGWLWRAFSR